MFHVISTVSKVSDYFPTTKILALVTAFAVGSVFAQPDPPEAPYLACAQAGAATDTVGGGIDGDGYISLFDGETIKGWWQSCQTAHGGPSKWKVVPGLKAIFSTQDGSKGSVLMTNRKFLHYELVWDYWPDFKNDGGLFNRTPANGSCFQTVLDYIGEAAVGGTWGENGFTGRDFRPWKFGADEKTIIIPGNNQGEVSNWTTITSKLKAAGQKFDCPNTGCTQADWLKLWDFDGWNQMRLQFYGGVAGDNRVRMKFWFRKVGATDWVPVSTDTTLMQVIPENYIGLQVHGGGRFSGARGTWYRNIKWTPLTPKGERIYLPRPDNIKTGKVLESVKSTATSLVGTLDLDHEITVKDVRGVTIQTIKGRAGRFEYAFDPKANGFLLLEIKTSKGTEVYRLIRDVQM